MTEPIRAADALSPLDARILRHLERYNVPTTANHVTWNLDILDAHPHLVSLAQRHLVERKEFGWRITPAGRRAVGAL